MATLNCTLSNLAAYDPKGGNMGHITAHAGYHRLANPKIRLSINSLSCFSRLLSGIQPTIR
ncbi:hypothetical protein [Spirosoma gilvum]